MPIRRSGTGTPRSDGTMPCSSEMAGLAEWYLAVSRPSISKLNEDTIWNRKRRDRINPQALKALPEVRRLLFAGKPAEAEALEERTMMGIPNRQPPNQPLGDLDIAFMSADNATDCRQE